MFCIRFIGSFAQHYHLEFSTFVYTNYKCVRTCNVYIKKTFGYSLINCFREKLLQNERNRQRMSWDKLLVNINNFLNTTESIRPPTIAQHLQEKKKSRYKYRINWIWMRNILHFCLFSAMVHKLFAACFFLKERPRSGLVII